MGVEKTYSYYTKYVSRLEREEKPVLKGVPSKSCTFLIVVKYLLHLRRRFILTLSARKMLTGHCLYKKALTR